VLHHLLEERLRPAVVAVLPEADPAGILVRPCPEPRFGDYQCTALMSLAKARRQNPRALAGSVLEHLLVEDLCETVELAGPGFINFRIRPQAVATELTAALEGKHLFFRKTQQPRTVVIDFSSPNVAKPMHVGHIRSTILGDSLARVLRLLGHHVITDNHIGDWGTQFGKLLVGWKQQLNRDVLQADPLAELDRLYKTIHAASEADPAVLDAARAELVKLQEGDEENLAAWRQMIELSRHQFDAIYGRLGVTFDHTLGESFYNPRLKEIVRQLTERGIAQPSEGAMVVFFEDDPALKAHPALIQKSDGAANYATTDLATLEYRLQTWHPGEIVYVTDSRQQLHFQQLFATFRRWHPETDVRLAHVWFGTILGEDGKPFRTRSGEVIRLSDLLDEAEQRAFTLVTEKNPDMDEAQRRDIARVVGLGAIKYADLLPNRQSDYVFSWDKMLALNGNTAPYLQYAYARIRSIFRRYEAAGEPARPDDSPPRVHLDGPEELQLAKQLLNFGLVLESVAEEYRPNYLCNYLYDLAGLYARFYEACPVLKADEPTRSSRLALCELVGRVIRQGLDALGIETLEAM